MTGHAPEEKQPKRIQRRREKGWKMPEGAVYVGRPTKWGNPFKVGEVVAPELLPYLSLLFLGIQGRPDVHHGLTKIRLLRVDDVVRLFDMWMCQQPWLMASLDELRGRDLVCWCPLDAPCHADVLLELANP